MNYESLIIVSAFIFSSSLSNAQDNKRADSLYKVALIHYQQKDLNNAKSEFEKVVILNPKHNDAIFNLGVINYEQGNKDLAISLFQTCVILRDRVAADLLKKELGQRILYADTMNLEDVDISPKVLVKSKEEDVFINRGLNRAIEKQIIEGIRKSKILKKELESTKRIFLSIYFGKDGKLNAIIVGQNKNQLIQSEITVVLQRIAIIPGKYDGKEVVTFGLTLPVVI